MAKLPSPRGGQADLGVNPACCGNWTSQATNQSVRLLLGMGGCPSLPWGLTENERARLMARAAQMEAYRTSSGRPLLCSLFPSSFLRAGRRPDPKAWAPTIPASLSVLQKSMETASGGTVEARTLGIQNQEDTAFL